MGTDPFKDVSSNEANRKEFASNAVKYLRMYGFDGLDVSWSNPDPAESFTELLAVRTHVISADIGVIGQTTLVKRHWSNNLS